MRERAIKTEQIKSFFRDRGFRGEAAVAAALVLGRRRESQSVSSGLDCGVVGQGFLLFKKHQRLPASGRVSSRECLYSAGVTITQDEK